MLTVAALYVDPRGPYPAIPGVDCWDEARDARKYDGPWPVVAHPACGPWSRLRHLYRGSDGGPDLAWAALSCVLRFGGALEHPAGSQFWSAANLPQPDEPNALGRTIEVNQSDWGHVARKRTWLFLVGVPFSALEPPPFPGRQPTHYASGGRTKSSRNGGAVPPGIKVCSAQQRRRTPQLFAEYLVRLARAAGEARRAA